MDHALTTLGLNDLLPLATPLTVVLASDLKRRSLKRTLHSSRCCWTPNQEESSPKALSFSHRDSFLVYLEQACTTSLFKHFSSKDCGESDDDTAVTLTSVSSSTEGEDEEDLVPPSRKVHFGPNLVTQVHTRPRTRSADKYYLYYNEHDYIDFKLDAMTGGNGRQRLVSFRRDVVTQVHSIPAVARQEKKGLFYTENELQW